MNKKQIDKFKQAARELECDESEGAFERKLKRVAKAIDGEKKDGSGLAER